MEFRVLDVEHVVEHRVELVLERADDTLERHHLLADDHDLGPDHAGEVAARARRYAPAHRTVERRVLQYVRATTAAHGYRAHGRHDEHVQPVHGTGVSVHARGFVPGSGAGFHPDDDLLLSRRTNAKYYRRPSAIDYCRRGGFRSFQTTA